MRGTDTTFQTPARLTTLLWGQQLTYAVQQNSRETCAPSTPIVRDCIASPVHVGKNDSELFVAAQAGPVV